MQADYRAHHSTQTGLLKLTDDIRIGMWNKKVIFLPLVDFSTAFYAVCHVRLLQKLNNFGFPLHTLRWFESYLFPRFQSVLYDNATKSLFLSTNMGIRLGSVLKPLQLAWFIYDIFLSFRADIFHILYDLCKTTFGLDLVHSPYAG